MEKEELIANLYALRAGMSTISCEKDLVDKRQQGIDSVNRQIDSNQESIKNSEEKIKLCKNQIANLNSSEERAVSDCREKKSDQRKRYILFMLFLPLICGGALAGLTFYITSCLGLWFSDSLIIILTIVGACVGFAVPVIGISLKIVAVNKKYNKEQTRIEKSYQEQKRDCAKNISIEEQNIRKKKESIVSDCKHNMAVAQTNYDNDAIPAIRRAEEMQVVLENTYSPIIMQSDWENVDLLIYYLSSGRADDLKEALQLYDRQRQTDEIVGAITEAEHAISNEIRSGFHALGTLMVKCFSALSEQLAEQHRQRMAALNNIAQSIRENTAVLAATSAAKILSDKELKSALSAKINASSQKLAEDMRAMKANVVALGNKMSAGLKGLEKKWRNLALSCAFVVRSV